MTERPKVGDTISCIGHNGDGSTDEIEGVVVEELTQGMFIERGPQWFHVVPWWFWDGHCTDKVITPAIEP